MDYKICPTCKKKFTKEEYAQQQRSSYDIGFLERDWKRKKYCSYDCATKYHNLRHAEKLISRRIINNETEFMLPVKIWMIEDGHVTEVKMCIQGKDMIFRKIDV